MWIKWTYSSLRNATALLDLRAKTCLAATPPLLYPLLGYIAGILAVTCTGHPSAPFLVCMNLLLIAALLIQKKFRTALAIGTAIVWGGCSAWNLATPDPYHLELIDAVAGQSVRIEGEVLNVAPRPHGWRMDLKLTRIITREEKINAAAMGVRIHVNSGPVNCCNGDHIALFTKLKRPRQFGTPGEFNYAQYLARHNISVSGFVNDSSAIARFAPTRPPGPVRRLHHWKQRTGQTIASGLQSPQQAYLLSLALGEKTRLSPEQRQVLAFTGLSHLFSISGLHLGMIAAFTCMLIRSLYRRSTRLLLWQPVQKSALLLSLPWVLAYLLLTGGALPTWRATIMLVAAAIVATCSYQTRPVSILVLAAGIILIFDPLAVRSASFQLSFSAVATLIFVLPVWHKRVQPGWKRGTVLLFMTSFTAFAATAPIALYHFHILAPATVLNNLFAVPCVSFFILPLTLGASALCSIHTGIGVYLLEFSAKVLTYILDLAQATATGFMQGQYWYPSTWILTAFTLGCLGVIFTAALHWRKGSVCLCLAAILPLCPTPQHTEDDLLRLTALSVGQGDAFLLQTPAGHNYLVDGGGLHSDTFDTGAQLVAPALQRYGITCLDAVILSHDHPDHSKGLNHILRHFPTRAFISAIPPDKLNPRLQSSLNLAPQVAVTTLPQGMFQLEPHVYIHVPNQNHRKLNERSIAIFAGLGSEGLLLTGDLEREGMNAIMHIKPPTAVTLFKLPHHGSRNSMPEYWLKTWDIKHAVGSCGYMNRFGFPHPQVQEILRAAEIPLWRTDLHGTTNFCTDGHGWKITTWKNNAAAP